MIVLFLIIPPAGQYPDADCRLHAPGGEQCQPMVKRAGRALSGISGFHPLTSISIGLRSPVPCWNFCAPAPQPWSIPPLARPLRWSIPYLPFLWGCCFLSIFWCKRKSSAFSLKSWPMGLLAREKADGLIEVGQLSNRIFSKFLRPGDRGGDIGVAVLYRHDDLRLSLCRHDLGADRRAGWCPSSARLSRWPPGRC